MPLVLWEMAREARTEWREFGERIRRYRAERGLSQAELARLVPVHDTYLSDVENGRRNIALTNIVRLAAALELDAGKLLEGITPDPKA